MDHEHRDVFIRKQVIEKRKQEAELAAQRREVIVSSLLSVHQTLILDPQREEMIRAQQYRQRRIEDEQARLNEEKIRREKEREERLEKDLLIAQNLAMIDKLKAAAAAAGETATLRSRKIIETLEGDAENVNREKLIEAQQEVQSQELAGLIFFGLVSSYSSDCVLESESLRTILNDWISRCERCG